MQLLVKRSQRSGGVFGGKVIFTLDMRADYTAEEKANINKYNLGGEVIYNSQAPKGALHRMERHGDGSGLRLLKGLGSPILAHLNPNLPISPPPQPHHTTCTH